MNGAGGIGGAAFRRRGETYHAKGFRNNKAAGPAMSPGSGTGDA